MGTLCVYKDDNIYFHHSIDENPKNVTFTMHAHEMCEILVVLSGKGSFLVEGTNYPVSAGSFFITREGETHKMNIDSSTPYERFSLHFERKIIEEIDPTGEILYPFQKRKLGKSNQINISNLDAKIESVVRLDSKTPSNIVRITLLSFILSSLVDILKGFTFDDLAENSDVIGRNFEIIDFVNTNIASDLSLDYLSSKFYISKSQLNRTFKQITGSTLWDYVIIKRLLLAKSIIKNGYSVFEAYKRSGFNDYSSFYRAYKKRFGESPNKK